MMIHGTTSTLYFEVEINRLAYTEEILLQKPCVENMRLDFLQQKYYLDVLWK